MTDDQIDNLLLKLSTLAMAHDVFESGLPMTDHDWVVKARALVRESMRWRLPAEPDVTKCPACGGPADNGYHRGDDVEPASALICSKCWKRAAEQQDRSVIPPVPCAKCGGLFFHKPRCPNQA